MRLTFWILVLANLLLYFWSQGYLGEADNTREPQRIARQVSPEKLHVVTANAAASGAAQKAACTRIEGLTLAEANELRGKLPVAPNWQSTLAPLKPASGYWVLIPELPDAAAAEKKRADLRKLGITEGQLVEDAVQGPFTISFGTFRNQPAADLVLQSLVKKNVKSARIARRDLPSDRYALELRAPADELSAKLAESTEKLSGTSQTDCANP